MICWSPSRLATHIFFALVFAIAASLLAPSASAQTVTTRKRIGGYAEDVAFVSAGKWKDHLVFTDGYELLATPYGKNRVGPLTKIADVRSLGLYVPRGITFVESERVFALNDVDGKRNRLHIVDDRGTPRETRTITYLNGYVPAAVEGLAYVPASSPNYPDHLIQVAMDSTTGPVRLEVLRRDGQVVAEIIPTWPAGYAADYMGDVVYSGPNRLLATFYDGTIWTLDFAGNVIGDPVETGAFGFEGIVRASRDTIAAVVFPQNILAFDNSLNRTPDDDRSYTVALDLNLPSGVAWDSTRSRYLVSKSDTSTRKIAGVPASLASATDVVDLTPHGFPGNPPQIAYVSNGDLIAAVRRTAPQRIVLFNGDGTLNAELDLSPLGVGVPRVVEYIPSTDQFAVRFSNPGDPAELQKLRILSRAGALVRTIDLSCVGVFSINDVAFFNPGHASGGQFLVNASFGRVLVTDFDGIPLSEFNSQLRLGFVPTSIAAITTGDQAGSFTAVDIFSGEIVVFELD